MNIRQKIYNNIYWILSCLIVGVFFLVLLITARITPFGNNSFANYDCFQQFVPFLLELRNKLLNHESLLYSWNVGLGSNFASLGSFYLFSPFNLLVVFFDRNNIYSFVTISICIRVIICAGTFACYLYRCKEGDQNTAFIVVFSVCYALSGYICGYYWNIMWLDSIMVLPLIILGQKYLIEKNKPILYILSLSYSIFCNYYLSFMICIFLVLYFFSYNFSGLKDFTRKLITFICSSIISAGMAAIPVVISLFSLIIDRSSHEKIPDLYWFGNVSLILRKLFYLSKPIMSDDYDGLGNVYCGTISIVLLFLFPFIKKINFKERVYKLGILIFLLVCMECSLLNFVCHCFHDQQGVPNRFSYIFIFLILSLAYEVVLSFNGFNKFGKYFFIVGAFLFPLIVYIFSDFSGFISGTGVLVVALILYFLYATLVVLYFCFNKVKKVAYWGIIAFSLVEVLSQAYISIRFNDLLEIDPYRTVLNMRYNSILFVKDKEKADSSEFYREEVGYSVIDNECTYQGISGISSFISSQDMSLVRTMGNLGMNATYPIYKYYSYAPNSPVLDDIFGVKYVYTFGKDRDEDNYELIYEDEINGVYSYKNNDALSIGFGVSRELIDVDKEFVINPAENQNLLLNKATGIDGPFDEIDSDFVVNCDVGEVKYNQDIDAIIYNNNTESDVLTYINAKTTISEDDEYYVSLPSEYVGDIYVIKNDEILVSGAEGGDLIKVGLLNSGEELTIIFGVKVASGNEVQIPLFLSVYSHTGEEQIIGKLNECNMDISSFDSTNIIGDVDLQKDQILLLTIPYDKGWKVLVDGKRADTLLVAGAFIGIDVGEGIHHVEMNYTPRGYILGCIISVIFWITFIILIVLIKKKGKIDNYDE